MTHSQPSPLQDEDWVRPDGKGGIFIGPAHVPAAQLPFVVALLYRVAGGREPIVLPRYKVGPTGEHGPGWAAARDGDEIRVRIYKTLPADEARTLAAVVAALADDQDTAAGCAS